MLRRRLLFAITSCFSERNIINVYCLISSYNNLHGHLKETKCINTMQMEEETKKVKLNDEEKTKQHTKRKKITVPNKQHVSDPTQSINSDMSNVCPKEYMKSLGINTDVLQLIDEEAAAKYVSLIIKDLLKNTCFVAEINPGFGIVTKRLLEAGVPLIHLYEARKDFHPILEKIQSIYPDRMNVRNFNLVNIGQLLYRDRHTGGNQVQENVLQNVENKKWEDESCMQIVGATNSSAFFRHLINSLIFQTSLMSNGRPVFYIMIPPSFWHKYTCDISNGKIYTSLKVMFQTMFHYEHLGTVDRKAFLPSARQKKTSSKHKYNSTFDEKLREDYKHMYVIKLEPRSDLYSLLTKKDWIVFWYFVRHHMRKRSNRLIPDLEKWAPGCGIKLIAKNYTIFTQFGDLTPTQILEVFKEFKSWPEYRESYFLGSMGDSLSTFNEPALLDFKFLQMDE
ncbi:hypothetical protein DMN91_006978 [Ooceraea biroi]|uniref:rRNA adenine N(6)-methyltransferase n=1 Tax=Ooceraea biroi TaxID=2015173 RepID=A0A026W748_OOCBI|nr:dimethyladenosine transferase 2, mitochondrial [Ooceraea biroi]XP_011342602.1 dimethyladenosine transferase 2, mitochondrial [Ooceraea biroi]EZA51932.1 Dimethyladenosine transferase 2, mitochondrial [Ooceraea biroi]RLU20370.1 hypothetical protein DMN91_006978 [Ooceraea biroi]